MNAEKITVPAELKQLAAVMTMINNRMSLLNCTQRTRMQIKVAVDEIFCNIARYAYDGEEGTITVQVEEEDTPPGLTIAFVDRGIPFNPLTAREPNLTAPAKKRPVGGLGLYIVKKTMDKVSYEYKDGYNVLTIQKYI